MDDSFFERPILNSPYDYPAWDWELDEDGQPTSCIIEEVWARLNSGLSRLFTKPKSGRIAINVINRLGEGVMRVFLVR